MPRRHLRQFSSPAHEPLLARNERRATGVYYTPPEIVAQIVELTLGPICGAQSGPLTPAHQPLRILDPACGAGEFLAAAQRLLVEPRRNFAGGATLLGVDIDANAVTTARQRLQTSGSPSIATEVITADALDASALPSASFDAVIGNPPYVSIRQLAKALPRQRIDELRERYQTAHGNFDLYVLFIERALELLRPGGRCGLIIPNKWATLDYARPCRELLLEQAAIEHVIDLSDARAFAKASVYPQIVVFRKEPAVSSHAVRFQYWQTVPCVTTKQGSLSPDAFAFQSDLDVESRVPTAPLRELATLSCGTAGFSAHGTARRLLDVDVAWQKDAPELADFITSGNIDRYSIELGNVRYLNHAYTCPRLPLDSPELTPAKRQLFASPKIVIAGMSRRLEAAWDDRGLALGVQVFAVSQARIDPLYLLALLNSKLLSYLFATRFAAKRLAGGYLAINKSQLARLPIAVPPTPVGTKPGPGDEPSRAIQLANSARRMQLRRTEQIDAEIDQLVYQLYRLAPAEIARVEQHFHAPVARAA